MESSNRDRTRLRHTRQLRALLAVALIWALPALACGSFAPRPTPTPTLPPPTPTLMGTAAAGVTQPITATVAPTPLSPLINPVVTGVATPAPGITGTVTVTATATPSATGGPTGLAPGQPALVTAPAGLNLRDQASTAGNLLVQLDTGVTVTVLEGPVQADNFTWWRIQDSTGRTGWAAQGDAETAWLSPAGAGSTPGAAPPQAQNRTPKVGERVVVTMGGGQLSVRAQPGVNATLVTRVNSGTEYTVQAGPQPADGYNWFQIQSDDGNVQGWAAEGEGTDRWLSPLE